MHDRSPVWQVCSGGADGTEGALGARGCDDRRCAAERRQSGGPRRCRSPAEDGSAQVRHTDKAPSASHALVPSMMLSPSAPLRFAPPCSALPPPPRRSPLVQEAANLALSRNRKSCNFIEWRDGKLIYKRYASLYFIAYTDKEDNELLTLEIIHHYVEILDRYFGNVCELDIIFNFHKVGGQHTERNQNACFDGSGCPQERDGVCAAPSCRYRLRLTAVVDVFSVFRFVSGLLPSRRDHHCRRAAGDQQAEGAACNGGAGYAHQGGKRTGQLICRHVFLPHAALPATPLRFRHPSLFLRITSNPHRCVRARRCTHRAAQRLPSHCPIPLRFIPVRSARLIAFSAALALPRGRSCIQCHVSTTSLRQSTERIIRIYLCAKRECGGKRGDEERAGGLKRKRDAKGAMQHGQMARGSWAE